MMKFVKMGALSALLGLGGIAAAPTMAAADSIHFSFGGTNGGPVIGVQYRDGGRVVNRGCSAREAVRKAERMGLRRVSVRSQNRNVIRVTGVDRRGRDTITFANARGCPVIR